MSLNEEEIEQLELLAILRAHGKLTEDQFQTQTSAILRVSAERNAPQHPLIRRIFNRKPHAPHTPKQKSVSPAPSREVVMERHLVPDELSGEHPIVAQPQPAVLSDAATIEKYKDRRRKPSLTNLVSMRTNNEDKQSSSIIPTLFTITVAILLTSLLASSSPMENLIGSVENAAQPAIALQNTPSPLQSAFVEPRFGPFAEYRCQSICAGKSASAQAPCMSSCERFALGEYGRRITLNPLNPSNDAREIIHSCQSKPLGKRKGMTELKWKKQAKKQLQMFQKADAHKLSQDFGSTRLRYEQTLALSNTLAAPETANPNTHALSEQVVRAACVRTHLSLAELGISVAHENDDTFSKRYYQTLYKNLRQSSEKLERDTLLFANNLGLLEDEEKK